MWGPAAWTVREESGGQHGPATQSDPRRAAGAASLGSVGPAEGLRAAKWPRGSSPAFTNSSPQYGCAWMGWWVTGSADTGCTLPDVGHGRRRCATMGRRLYDPLREFVAGPRGGMGDVHNSARPSVDGTTPATRPWPRSKGLPASEAVSRLVVTDPDWGPSWRPSPWRAEGVGSAQTRPNTPTTVTTTHRKAPSNVTRDGRRPGTLRTVVEPLPAGVVPALVSRGIRTTTTPPVIHTRGVERLIGRPHCQTRSSHMLAPAALTPGPDPRRLCAHSTCRSMDGSVTGPRWRLSQLALVHAKPPPSSTHAWMGPGATSPGTSQVLPILRRLGAPCPIAHRPCRPHPYTARY